MKLYVTYGDKLSNQWTKLCELELKSEFIKYPKALAAKLEGMNLDKNSIGLSSEVVILPNGEQLELSVAYATGNRGISINVFNNGKHLRHVGGFKLSETSYDPGIFFLTPKGLHVSLMVGV